MKNYIDSPQHWEDHVNDDYDDRLRMDKEIEKQIDKEREKQMLRLHRTQCSCGEELDIDDPYDGYCYECS